MPDVETRPDRPADDSDFDLDLTPDEGVVVTSETATAGMMALAVEGINPDNYSKDILRGVERAFRVMYRHRPKSAP